MPRLDIAQLLNILFTGGALTALAAGVKGFNAWRGGASTRQREAVNDLGRLRDDIDERRRRAEMDRDFWRDECAERGWKMVQHGVRPDNPNPIPPSERLPPVESWRHQGRRRAHNGRTNGA